jgi:hypothetical protein
MTGMNAPIDKRLAPNRLCPHRLILATTGPYSGVAGSALGLSDDLWSQLSVTIRIEHECTHYLTRRLLGAMANKLLDEIIADFSGIVAAKGAFCSDWFLKFMGVDAEFGNSTKGRFSNYLGSPPLSSGSRRILCALVWRAARNLEALGPIWDQPRSTDASVAFRIALAALSLEELASEEFTPRITAKFQLYRQRFCAKSSAPGTCDLVQ